MDSKKIFSGIKWATLQTIIDIAFRFGIKFILIKLLLPEQFGLIGMCSIFIVIAGAAGELGMSAALIQKKNENEVVPMYSTAFWTGIMWGWVVFLIMALVIGPFASYFYSEPKLIYLIPVLSLSILFRPLGLIHTVILTRKLNFKSLAKISNISAIIAGLLALILAFFGGGVWALVLNMALAPVISLPLLYLNVGWKPKWEWKKEYFNNIFGFGAFSSTTQILSMIMYNVDNLVIGKVFGATKLGYYTLAFSLTEQIRQTISAVLNKVMFPVFGNVQDKKEVIKGYFLKIIKLNAMVIFPYLGFLIVFATDVVNFFGPEWGEAIIPLQILALATMVHITVNSFASILRGIGHPKIEMKIILFTSVLVFLPSLLIGVYYFGIIGAASAVLFNKIALVILGLATLRKYIDVSIHDVFRAVFSTIFIVLGSMAIVFCSNLYLPEFSTLLKIPLYFTLCFGGIIYSEKSILFSLTKHFA
ncbi:lipopolysaccharide biosynthesis protein [Echinicola pacifica]|uniref:Lipopolysaccharide biosynthesis protein n=1 Tax=Echinicola pacifica TaxID=346377 RepID=A0A918PM90_9BACT|nr:lipopolysaccharide biosynthesis protein [Echinicola pacifica]GGZ15382.1 lipopolysaccharide biosynthesis protein [Echinicola pacifica]